MEEGEFFVLGYWDNAYSRGRDREYFWMRGFESRKEALDAAKSKQERGQPTQFRDWVKGRNQVFSKVETFLKAAEKVGLNPRLD